LEEVIKNKEFLEQSDNYDYLDEDFEEEYVNLIQSFKFSN